jgi:hypothetical protein
MAKLHDLLSRPAIDRTNVTFEVVVTHNEKGVFQLRGASTHRNNPSCEAHHTSNTYFEVVAIDFILK